MKRYMRCTWLVLVCMAPLWPGSSRADDPFPAPQVYIAGNNVVGGTVRGAFTMARSSWTRATIFPLVLRRRSTRSGANGV
jgi:hypothetical protein